MGLRIACAPSISHHDVIVVFQFVCNAHPHLPVICDTVQQQQGVLAWSPGAMIMDLDAVGTAIAFKPVAQVSFLLCSCSAVSPPQSWSSPIWRELGSVQGRGARPSARTTHVPSSGKPGAGRAGAPSQPAASSATAESSPPLPGR